MQWVAAHWEKIFIAGLVAVQLINKITTRWDELDGPEWKRVLLLYSELASILVSKGRTGVLGWLKLPGDPFGGRAKAVKPPTAGVTIVLMLAMAAAACAPSWRQQADQSIAIVHKTAQRSWNMARVILHEQCMDAVSQCKTLDTLNSCTSLVACQKLGRDIETALKATHEMCALASEGLQAYDELARAGASNEALDKKQAEVRERVDRAQRQNVNFLQRLKDEGLAQ